MIALSAVAKRLCARVAAAFVGGVIARAAKSWRVNRMARRRRVASP